MGEETFDTCRELIIRSASSGRALRAQSWVLGSMNALDSSNSHSAVTVGKQVLLEPPKDVYLSSPCQNSYTRNFAFSSSEESSGFCKAVMEKGGSVIWKLQSEYKSMEGAKIDLGASLKGSDHQSMEGNMRTGGKVRSSRITRCVYIPKKSFQIPMHSMRLCDAALATARKVGSLSDAWTFLNAYGSHVSCSLYHLGGIFLEEHDNVSKQGASSSSEDQHSSSSNEKEGNASVSVFSPGGGGSGAVSRNSSKSGEFKNENTSDLKKSSKEVFTLGPTNVSDEAAFRCELKENSLSWSIIDKAVDTQEVLVGVWDIILEKHAAITPDDDDDVDAPKKLERAALYLCQAWLITAASSRSAIPPELNGLIERGNKLLRQLAPSAPPLPAVLPQPLFISSTGCCRKADFELQFTSPVENSSYTELQDALATGPRAEVGNKFLQVFETLKGTLIQETAKKMAAQKQREREPSAAAVVVSSTTATDFHASLENGVKDVVDIQSKELQKILGSKSCWSNWKVQETQNWGTFCNNLQESYRSRVRDLVHDGELKFEAAVLQYEMQMKDEIVQKFHSKEGWPLPNVGSMSKEEQKAARDKLFGDIFDKIKREAKQSHPPLAEQVPRKVDEAYEQNGIAKKLVDADSLLSDLGRIFGGSRIAVPITLLMKCEDKFVEKVQDLVKECIDHSLKDAKQYSKDLVKNVILQTKDILIKKHVCRKNVRSRVHSYAKKTLKSAMQEIQSRWDQEHNITEKLRAAERQLRGFFEACADGQLQLLMEEELVGDHQAVLVRVLANSLSNHGWVRDRKKMRACLDLHLLTLMDNKINRNCTRNVEKLLDFVRDGSAHYETVMNALIRKEITKGLAAIYMHSSDSIQKVAMCCNPTESGLQEIVRKVREMMEDANEENARPRCATNCPLCGRTCKLSTGHSGRHDTEHQIAGLAGWRRIKSEEIWHWSCYDSMVKGETFLHEGSVYNYNETEMVFPDWKKPDAAALHTHSVPEVQEYIFYNYHHSLIKRYGMKPCTEMPTIYNHDIQMLHTTLRNVLQDDDYTTLRETFEESIRNNTL